MKLITKFLMIALVLTILIFPISADSYDDYQTYGLSITPTTTLDMDSALQTSGASVYNLPVDVDITVRFSMMIVNTQSDQDLQNYMRNVIVPILNDYDGDGVRLKRELDGKLNFGDKTRQPTDYYKIEYVGRENYTGRFCFSSEVWENFGSQEYIYKYPSTAINKYTFDCSYKVKQFGQMTNYQIGYGDLGAHVMTHINDGMMVYPIVYMEEFYQGGYSAQSNQVVYLTVDSIKATYNRTPSIVKVVGNSNYPVLSMNTSYSQYFLNALYDDFRYTYNSIQNASVTVKLGQQGTGTELKIPNTSVRTNIAQQMQYYNPDGVMESYRYYNTTIQQNALNYIVSDYTITYQQQLVDGAGSIFDYYMRVGVYENYDSLDAVQLSNLYNNAPFSASATVLYQPKANVQIANNNGFQLGEINADKLYQSTAIVYNTDGNLFQDIANFFGALFTVTIPAIINNFIVWFMLEAPLISNVTGPLYSIGHTTGSIITQFMLPLIASVGIFGAVFVLVLVVKLIVRLFK